MLGRVLGHVDPSGTYRLTGSRSVPVVAGFDATFCAPKSVSLLFALGDPEVSNEVRNAHDAAVAASLEVLEDVACRVRRGPRRAGGPDGDGFVAAAFRHRTSRAGDPHLHTHVVIANLAHSPSDDRWTALDARPVYCMGRRRSGTSTRRSCAGSSPSGSGSSGTRSATASPMSPASPDGSCGSSRPVAVEIEAHLDEHGQHGAKAAQVSRPTPPVTAKDPSLDAEGLLPGWRARAETSGFDADGSAQRARPHSVRSIRRRPDSPEAEVLYRLLASPEGLTAEGQHVRRNVTSSRRSATRCRAVVASIRSSTSSTGSCGRRTSSPVRADATRPRSDVATA